MNQVLSQSATNIAVSSTPEEQFDFALAAERACKRNAKGMTRERSEINRNKVLNAVRADYRSHYPAIYSKTDRIPSDINDKLEAAVDAYIEGCLKQVNLANCTGIRKSFSHKASQMKFVEKVTVTGENEISLKEQSFACTTALEQLNRREADAEKRNNCTDEMRKAFREQRMRLEVTKTFITREIEHQNKVVAETKAE